jgi:hypothetical protein
MATSSASGLPARDGIAGRLLLVCGVLAPVVYVGADVVSALNYPGYSYADQAVSELSAVGAPTRPLWIVLQFVFNPLLIAFGISVRATAGTRSLRIAGVLLVAWGISGFAWLLFPMNMRGAIGSTTDTMHLVLTGVTVPLILLIVWFGSGANGTGFRVYSVLTGLAMLAFGALTATQAPAVAAQLPTPGMGIMERITVFAPMLWLAVLAILLLRRGEAAGPAEKTG